MQDEESLWHIQTPSLWKCCICGGGVVGRVIEERPTGSNKKIQEWAYCEGCWGFHQRVYALTEEKLRLVGLERSLPQEEDLASVFQDLEPCTTTEKTTP